MAAILTRLRAGARSARLRALWIRARLGSRPLRAEIRADQRRIAGAAVDWQRWFAQSGRDQLRCLLMASWDPVGVNDIVDAWDEYDDYLAGIGVRLRENSGDARCAARAVAGHLEHIETDWMGTPMAGRRDYRSVALLLVAWHERCAGLTPRAPAHSAQRGAEASAPDFERWWESTGATSYAACSWARGTRRASTISPTNGIATTATLRASPRACASTRGRRTGRTDTAQAVAEHLRDAEHDDIDTRLARSRDHGDIAWLLVAWYQHSFILGGRVPRLADPDW